MRETPVPRDPRRDEDPPGVLADPGDHPWLGPPDWRLVPQSPDWDEAWLTARAEDEDPGDPTWLTPQGQQQVSVAAVDPAGYAALTADTPFPRIAVRAFRYGYFAVVRNAGFGSRSGGSLAR